MSFVVPPQGSGKSALSRALCAKAREHLDAHVEIVDCKKLQGTLTISEATASRENEHVLPPLMKLSLAGKRAETVRQTLRDVFEQAEWRQPAVVLLDDLDHVTGAVASPEHEHGPDAALQQHIAQSKKINFSLLLGFQYFSF